MFKKICAAIVIALIVAAASVYYLSLSKPPEDTATSQVVQASLPSKKFTPSTSVKAILQTSSIFSSKTSGHKKTPYISQRPYSFADIIDPLLGSIVNIYTTQKPQTTDHKHANSPFENFPSHNFGEFFKRFDMPAKFEGKYTNPKAISVGSGVVVDDHYIITTRHAIKGLDQIYVRLNDRTEFPAKVIGSDTRTDIAILRVETSKKLPSVKLGNSGNVRVGDWALVSGNPFGVTSEVTLGIVSSKFSEESEGDNTNDYLQIDTPIEPGKSGGATFNIYGEVIGINTAIFAGSEGGTRGGFIIPSNTVKAIAKQLRSHGEVSKGSLRITVQDMTDDIAEGMGILGQSGVLVSKVDPDGDGARAGLKVGDIVAEFNGGKIKEAHSLGLAVLRTPVNNTVRVMVYRDGKPQELRVKITDLDTRPGSEEDSSFEPESGEKYGVVFSSINNLLIEKHSLKTKTGLVVVNVKKGTRWDVLRGDVIIACNNHAIHTIEDFSKAIEEAKRGDKKNAVVHIKRQDNDLFIALPV